METHIKPQHGIADVENWLLTEGNQYFVKGVFTRVNGKLAFVGEEGEALPVPEWGIVNMMLAYKLGITKLGAPTVK